MDIVIGGGLVLLLLIFAIWGTSRVINLRSDVTPQPTAPSIANILGTVQEAATASPTTNENSTSTFIPAAGETLVQTLPASGNGAVKVVVIAMEQAWIRVTVDGKVAFEGRTTARELTVARIAVTLVTDAQGPLFLRRADAGRVAAVLVGADGVLADGAVINKTGTYPLALAARDSGLPFYVACESLKISSREEWSDADMEEGDPAEVLPEPLPGVTPRNLYFECTLARLVTALITDEGVFRPDQLGPLVERARRRLEALRG